MNFHHDPECTVLKSAYDSIFRQNFSGILKCLLLYLFIQYGD